MNRPLHILALDAAFGPACACLIRQDGKRCFSSTESDTPHSQAVLPMLCSLLGEAGLNWQDLQLLAVGVGPGSFTGLRVAAASMAGINAALGLPVLAVSSLAITAMQTRTEDPVHVVEDAHAGDAYIGIYQSGKALVEDRCLSWDKIRLMPLGTYISHTEPVVKLPGWRLIPFAIPRPQALAELICGLVGEMVDTDRLPTRAIPAYLSASQAEKHACGA